MKVSEILTNAAQFPMDKARNIATVGWWNGYLTVKFKGRETWYVYGPDIPEAELLKIIKNPYPDSLLTKLREKHKWKCHKVNP